MKENDKNLFANLCKIFKLKVRENSIGNYTVVEAGTCEPLSYETM